MRALAAFLILLLAACQSAPPTVELVRVCPPLKTYSAAQQQELASEWDELPEAAKMFIDDYQATRQSIRACEASR